MIARMHSGRLAFTSFLIIMLVDVDPCQQVSKQQSLDIPIPATITIPIQQIVEKHHIRFLQWPIHQINR